MNQKTVDHFAAKTRRKMEINNLADWMSLLFFPRTGEAEGDFLWGWRAEGHNTQERHRIGGAMGSKVG
jgi:hypothetical protein